MLHSLHFTEQQQADARTTTKRLCASWIDGRYHRDVSLARMELKSPYDDEVLAIVELADDAIVASATQAARKAFKGPWRAMPQAERAALLHALAAKVDKHRAELALLEALDVGKPVLHAYNDDVPGTASLFRWYAGLIETAYDIAPTRHDGVLAQVMREPHGVVGIVLPWNYPLITLAMKIGPALAAGNCVVCKPADDTPLTTLRLAELATEVGFPDGVINVVPGTGPVAGKAIGLSPDIDAINFTGSTNTGRQFLRYAADSNLKEVSLECGGKNPGLILPDLTNLDQIAEDLCTGFMMNTGQVCSSISRILAPRALEPTLRRILEEGMRAWPIGNPLNPSTRLGPLINDAQLAKVTRFIEQEKQNNPDFAESTAPVDGISPRFVKPIVFYNVSTSSPVWTDEIFGPVAAVQFYDDFEDALERANNTAYGLAAYVFGNDARLVTRASQGLDAGIVSVNAFTEGDLSTPFGGFKASGFGGKDKGLHSLDQYSRTKSVWWKL